MTGWGHSSINVSSVTHVMTGRGHGSQATPWLRWWCDPLCCSSLFIWYVTSWFNGQIGVLCTVCSISITDVRIERYSGSYQAFLAWCISNSASCNISYMIVLSSEKWCIDNVTISRIKECQHAEKQTEIIKEIKWRSSYIMLTQVGAPWS